jgi:NAD(P)-dependent dehydrogenase (short-subunit alcohol dehydrogenase family)
MTKWNADDVVDQTGRTFIVTGANSGLGAEVARSLGKAGANVILACRNIEKAEVVASSIGSNATVRRLDLADLGSVRAFAETIDSVDVLVNNAGVMAVPLRRTVDGFEMQIGTNHLGHFALTGLLMDKLIDRVVTMSSILHQLGTISRNDFNWEQRKYNRWEAYGQSKLANLLFTYELQRKLSESDSALKALASHPGYADTNLQGRTETIQDKFVGIGNKILAQSAQMGSLPELSAATDPDLLGGSFIGPDGLFEQRGHPTVVRSNKKSHDERMAADLWTLSEELTGVSYNF